MGAYNVKLKKQLEVSIANIYKASLEEVERLLAAIEATIGLLPSVEKEKYEPEFHYLNEYFKQSRRKILGVGNDELRKLSSLIDCLDVSKRQGHEDVIFFNFN